MRSLVTAGAAGLFLLSHSSVAAPITFTYTGAIVDYSVPTTGLYTITAIGGRGGSVLDQGGTGGLGAEAGGTLDLFQGELLRILVGAAGADNAIVSMNFEGFAGGGGGSFIVGPGNQPLVVAGGGGGGGQLSAAYPPTFQEVRGGSRYNGGDGLTGPNGGASIVLGDLTSPAPLGGAGGTGGADGQGGNFAGAGRSVVDAGRGFASFPLALGAGAFGGGGLADNAGGGGGGGYSGGGGGGVADVIGTFKYGFGGGGGGGGGSFTAGADPLLVARVGTGNGVVTITADVVSVAEPVSLSLYAAGLVGLLAARRRR